MNTDENPLVVGSTPATRTSFAEENEVSSKSRTDSAQNPTESEAKGLKFPKVIRHRKEEATIYGKKANYPFYRVCFYDATHKRRMKHFATYSEALSEAEKVVRQLSQNSAATALSPSQASDALAALEILENYRTSTGNHVSLRVVAAEYVEAAKKLNGRTMGDALDAFNATVAAVKRVDVSRAVDEFLAAEEPRTRASNGQRPQLSSSYAYVRAIRLKRFSAALPNTAVCDLSKAHLDAFFASKLLSELSAKSRNHYRAAIGQFISWSVRKDYLPANHRLTEADAMRVEEANTAEILFYTPGELRALLETAVGTLQPMIAIGGLAGLRTAELLRLTWEDVWRVPGHIEVTAGKSKTRQRRLVEMCPALVAWVEPYQRSTGKVWTGHENVCPERNENLFHEELVAVCQRAGVTPKTNGLRHGFATFAYALHGELWAAQMAGHSPAMLHANYRALATKAEAEKWFAVAPAKADNVVPMAATGATN